MPVPNFQKLLLPALQVLSGVDVLKIAEIGERAASILGLDQDEQSEMLSSGRRTFLQDRISWAVSHLKRAGLVTWVRKGAYRISADGQKLLATNPSHVDVKLLETYESYRDWKPSRRQPSGAEVDSGLQDGTSGQDSLESDLSRIRAAVASAHQAEILKQLRNSSSSCLDQIVADLMTAIGFSTCHREASRDDGGQPQERTGGSLWQDALGISKVYLKTQHVADSTLVSEQALRDFAASMVGSGADQGVLISTATFSSAAAASANQSGMRIALIDGQRLAELLSKHGSWCA